jgi:hypothetical protein
MTEAAVRDVDDVRLDRAKRLVPEAPSVEHAGGEILRHDVRALDQSGEELLATLRAQVERDAALLRVVVVEAAPEIGSATLVDERRHRAQDVPRALVYRVLDANHVRAEGREPLGGTGAGELAREVADADAREGSLAFRHSPTTSHCRILRRV